MGQIVRMDTENKISPTAALSVTLLSLSSILLIGTFGFHWKYRWIHLIFTGILFAWFVYDVEFYKSSKKSR